jgi:hypothetical protein
MHGVFLGPEPTCPPPARQGRAPITTRITEGKGILSLFATRGIVSLSMPVGPTGTEVVPKCLGPSGRYQRLEHDDRLLVNKNYFSPPTDQFPNPLCSTTISEAEAL